VFKKLIVGAALSISSFAVAAPPHRAVPVASVAAPSSDHFDVAQGRRLLRELDASRRGFGSGFQSGNLDQRIVAFITAELNESRRDVRAGFDRRDRREERLSTRQLSQLLGSFSRVQGRFDFRAMAEKRRVLVAAIDIAERDLDDSRGARFSRR
jgi:hypothetical protein